MSNEKQILLINQYVKDLSFENPNAPGSLMIGNKEPSINLNLDIKASKINEEESLYQTDLIINVHGRFDNKDTFVIELNYSGIFRVQELEGQELEMILFVYCPNLLFPFARRIIADIVRDAGFVPLMLKPLDFMAIYQHKLQEKAKLNGNDNNNAPEGDTENQESIQYAKNDQDNLDNSDNSEK